MKPAVMHFDFGPAAVRVIMKGDVPWFVAVDVAEVLGYRNAPDALRMLPKAQIGSTRIVRSTSGGNPNLAIINEAGLYRLILRSRKPEAEAFTDWVTSEVLPSIRQTGEFRAQWSKNRLQAAASYRVMNEVLRMTREGNGKQTAQHHYSNEARLINYVLCGKFAGLTRDGLPDSDLALIAYLEERNAILIARDVVYQNRKAMLEQYAMDWRMQNGQLSRRNLRPHDCDQIWPDLANETQPIKESV